MSTGCAVQGKGIPFCNSDERAGISIDQVSRCHEFKVFWPLRCKSEQQGFPVRTQGQSGPVEQFFEIR